MSSASTDEVIPDVDAAVAELSRQARMLCAEGRWAVLSLTIKEGRPEVIRVEKSIRVSDLEASTT